MPYSQKNNPIKMMKSALKIYKDDKKSGMHRDSAMYMKHGMHRDSSMYMKDGMHRESAEFDMPVIDIEKGDAKGDINRYSSTPAMAAKPDFPDIDGDGNTTESMKKAAADKKKGSPAMKKGSKSLEDLQDHLTNLKLRLENAPPSEKKLKPMYIKQIAATKKKIQVLKDEKSGNDSPVKKYDRVVLGGNKGDKSKTKPGKKDYMDKK